MTRRKSRPAAPLATSAKRIHKNSLIGQRGVNLIERIVLDMGFLWHPTGAIEAGVDGSIEIRDPNTGEVRNLIIQVQSKATEGAFQNESGSGLEYTCEERDLDYWLYGNAPIILVVSRPATDEAYWIDIKTYFSEPSRRKTRKIIFDKANDCFDASCRPKLLRVAAARDTGIYLSPPPQLETLYTNLLRVTAFTEHIYVADTEHRTPRSLLDQLSHSAGNSNWGRAWFLKNGRIISFYDLDDHPWNSVCEVGTLERFATREWAYSDDADRTRDFVHLLNRALREMLGPTVRYSEEMKYYYFTASSSLSPRKIAYRSRKSETTRTVFKGYPRKDDPERIAYYRHSAFNGFFHRYGGEWYLEISPTYHYTRDGRQPDGFYEQRLKGIKQLERNEAVLGQLLMWAAHLARTPDMFSSRRSLITFGELQTVEVALGIDDEAWLETEDRDEAKRTQDNDDQLQLFDDL
jgi:hypothetical protein